MVKVLASGVFDILHPGHIYYLNEAKKLGGKLTVIVTSDGTATQQKHRPIFSEERRAKMISHLKMVDEVIIGRPGKKYESIIDVWPDIIALGWDQRQKLKVQSAKLKITDEDILELRAELEKYHWQGEIVRVGKLPEQEISSSIIKQTLLAMKSQAIMS